MRTDRNKNKYKMEYFIFASLPEVQYPFKIEYL